MQPAGLSPEQRDTLETRGLVKLPGAIPQRDAEAMADRLWATLAAKHHIQKGVPATWTVERPSSLGHLCATGAFGKCASPAVTAALDGLLGAWTPPKTWGPVLVCFPNGEPAWSLPHQSWHLDSPADAKGPMLTRLARVFAILAPLEPQGGATLVAEGSHVLAEREAHAAGHQLRSAEVRKRLARHAWIRDLATPGDRKARVGRFMDEPTEVDGVDLRVTEMTGEPGDVWMMHPNCLHAGAPNVRNGPRMVVTQWIYAEGANPWGAKP